MKKFLIVYTATDGVVCNPYEPVYMTEYDVRWFAAANPAAIYMFKEED